MTTHVMAISDLSADTAGAIVLWRLQGTTDYEKFKTALVTAGLQHMVPSLPSAATALRRAMKDQENKRMLVRTLPGRGVGYALVEESTRPEIAGECAPLEYAVLLTVRLHQENGEVGLDFAPEGVAVADEIRSAMASNMLRLEAADTGSWLVDAVQAVKAVPLRDTGGVYFVPRETLPTWRAAVAALRGASASYTAEIPALRSSEAMEAILDSLSREADTVLSGLQAELQAATQTVDGMGSRAIKTRLARCAGLEEKLGVYERLLGVKLEDMRTRMEGLQANLAAAALIAHAQEA